MLSDVLKFSFSINLQMILNQRWSTTEQKRSRICSLVFFSWIRGGFKVEFLPENRSRIWSLHYVLTH